MGNMTSLFKNAIEGSGESPEYLFGKHTYLLKYWKELTPEQRQQLVNQCKSIDADSAIKAFYDSETKKEISCVEPIPDDHCIKLQEQSVKTLNNYWNRGLEAIANGKICAIVLAGGQASRLGVSCPKGILPLDITSECNTLFALQAFRLVRLQNLARRMFPASDCIIPWYIMTSDTTYDATMTYLKENIKNFGLLEENVQVFVQGQMPCFDMNGNFILADKAKVATSPNGNGGVYGAIAPYLKSMRSKGIEYVNIYCVDNILCRVADPYFVGFCIANNADCAAKVIEKTDPNESVGVFCQVEGKVKLIEYSEARTDLTEKRNVSGRLVLHAANIANHMLSMDFLEKVCADSSDLPYHRAVKKIPYFDGKNIIKPDSPNGIKLERFVTDVFGYANNFFLWEVDREAEFSPLKNPNIVGKDCLNTCLRDLHNEHKRWLISNGAIFDGNPQIFIHPLRSYFGEELEEYRGRRVEKSGMIH